MEGAMDPVDKKIGAQDRGENSKPRRPRFNKSHLNGKGM
jgi:hypothetical protein